MQYSASCTSATACTITEQCSQYNYKMFKTHFGKGMMQDMHQKNPKIGTKLQ
jgi:hypothetical protein